MDPNGGCHYIYKWIQINGYIYIYNIDIPIPPIYIIIYRKINEHRPSSSANPGRKTSAIHPTEIPPGCRGSQRSRRWCLPVCKAPGISITIICGCHLCHWDQDQSLETGRKKAHLIEVETVYINLKKICFRGAVTLSVLFSYFCCQHPSMWIYLSTWADCIPVHLHFEDKVVEPNSDPLETRQSNSRNA